MKGQATTIPETILDLMELVFMTVFTLAILLHIMLYSLTYESRFEDRKLIDSIENFLGLNCWNYKEGDEYVRGVLDSTSLDAGENCFNSLISSNVNFIVKVEGKEWNFGTSIPDSKTKAKFVFPAVVAYSDTSGTRFVPAKVEGRI